MAKESARQAVGLKPEASCLITMLVFIIRFAAPQIDDGRFRVLAFRYTGIFGAHQAIQSRNYGQDSGLGRHHSVC